MACRHHRLHVVQLRPSQACGCWHLLMNALQRMCHLFISHSYRLTVQYELCLILEMHAAAYSPASDGNEQYTPGAPGMLSALTTDDANCRIFYDGCGSKSTSAAMKIQNSQSLADHPCPHFGGDVQSHFWVHCECKSSSLFNCKICSGFNLRWGFTP